MFCFHFEARLRPVYAIDVQGLSTVEWGIILTASQFISTGAVLLVGWFIDRYGRVKVFIPSIALLGVAAYLFTVAQTFATFLVAMVLVSLCLKARMVALQVLLADTTPRGVRGTIFGAVSVISSLGTSASVLLSGVLYDVSPTLPFYIATVMYFLATVTAIRYLREAELKQV
jgi:MFS family permease